MLKWKILGIAAAVLLLTLLGTALWINSVAERRMARMELKVKALQAEVLARDASRAPRGQALPGNAWDDYFKAFDDIEADGEGFRAIQEFVQRSTKADRAKAAAVVASHVAALDHLRRGVRRERGDYPIRWEQDSARLVPSSRLSQRLASLAAARARLLSEEGTAREAAELLLDACQFARDEGYNASLLSQLIALGVYNIVFEELRDILLSGKLSREELLAVDQALEGMDRDFPKYGHALLNESLWLGNQFLQKAGSGKANELLLEGGRERTLKLWRYGFSARIVAAQAFDESLAAMTRLAAIDDKPWGEAGKLTWQLEEEYRPSANPIVPKTMLGISAGNRASRERRAQLRILRTAVHHRATGEQLDLDDPYGTKLHRAEKDGKLKIWSVGTDGSDDAGTGGWKQQDSKDIVLEISR